MRRYRLLTAACIVCLLVPAVTAAPLAERVPSGSLLYAGWAGRTLVFDGSMFGQLIQEPAFDEILKTLHTAMIDNTRGDERVLATNAWSLASIAWEHPIALAVIDVTGGEGGPPMPSAALLIDLQDEKDDFARSLDSILATVGEDLRITEKTAGPVTYRAIRAGEAPEIALGYIDNLFFVAVGPDTVRRLVELKPADSLQADGKFADSIQAVSGENEQFVYYADVTKVRRRVTPLLPPSMRGADGEDSKVDKILAALGLEKVTTIAGATRIVDRGLYTRTKVFTPAPHHGLLTAVTGAPLGDADLAGVPADADFFWAGRFNPETMYAELRRALREGDGDADEQFSRMLAQAEDELGGMSIRDDLIAPLGDTWVVSSAPSQGGFLTGTVLSVTVKDPEKLRESIARLESRLVPDREPTPRHRRRRGPAFGIEKSASDGLEVHYLQMLGRMPIPFAPAWAVHDERLYLAGWPQVIETTVRNGREQPLVKSDAYRELRGRFAAEAQYLSYCNTPKMIRQGYNYALFIWTMLANVDEIERETGIRLKAGWLPALATLEKYIWPEMNVVSADETGITVEHYGSLPIQGLAMQLSPQNAAAIASILMPALARARNDAKQAASMSNMNSLGKGVALYMGDNDTFPTGYVPMIEEGVVGMGTLVSPASGRQPPRVVDGKLVGEVDYIMYYYENFDAAPYDLILAYERPENYDNEETIVLFPSFSVQQVSYEEFRRLKERTEEWLAENNPGGVRRFPEDVRDDAE